MYDSTNENQLNKEFKKI